MDWESLTDKFSAAGERFGKGMLRVFGSQNERAVKRMEPVIDRITDRETTLDPTAAAAGTGAFAPVSGLLGLLLTDLGLRLNSL